MSRGGEGKTDEGREVSGKVNGGWQENEVTAIDK